MDIEEVDEGSNGCGCGPSENVIESNESAEGEDMIAAAGADINDGREATDD